MNNRPPLANYPTSRGYGLDSTNRFATPYQGHGMKPYYPPNVGTMPSSIPSPYRIEAMQSAERIDSSASTSTFGRDELNNSSDEDSRNISHSSRLSGEHHRALVPSPTSGNRGKKRDAPLNSSAPASKSKKQSISSTKAIENSPTSSKSHIDVQSTAIDTQGSVDGQKRKKKAVSCEGCRRRKLKCDRGWPCGACRDRDEAHLCSWEGGTRPQGTGRDQENVPLLMRMEKMESLLSKIADHIGMNGIPASKSNENPLTEASTSTSSSSISPLANVGAALTVKEKAAPGFWMRGMNVGLLATGHKLNSDDEMAAELLDILRVMPDNESVRKMCHCFFDEVNWMHYAVDEDTFWQKLCEVEEIRTIVKGESSPVIVKEHVRDCLQFVALILSMCAFALLFSDESDYPEVIKSVGISPAYGPFIDGAQRALAATNPFDEPTLLSLRVLLLLMWAVGSVRGPAGGHSIQATAVAQMYALELDIEPAPSMPKAQARDRIRLFHSLVVLDWFGAGSIKRWYLIPEEPVKHPYLFGRQNIKEGLSDKDAYLLPDMWLKLEVARINRRAADRAAMKEDDAYSTTLQLQGELDEIFSDLPSEFEAELYVDRLELDVPAFHRLAILMLVANQLINLHKRYYIQGWLNPVFRTSRDICFSSARRICLLFRKTFNHAIPMDKLMTLDAEQIKKRMEGRQKLVSRLWFFAHSSVGACLLLQHHYALMDVHPDAAGPNAEKVRTEIIDDLRYTRRLLLAMSTRSQIARSGIAVLARPDLACSGGAEAANFNHGQAMQHISRSYDGEIGEDELSRRADLAKDLQSITDHDSFATKRFKMHGNDSLLTFRSRRHHRPSNSNEMGNGTTPQSTAQSTTPTSTHSNTNGPHSTQSQSNKFPQSDEGQVHNRSSFTVPDKPQSRQMSQNVVQRSFPINTNQNNGGNNNHVNNQLNGAGQMSDMEAFLESALSTDFTTGLPIAPEVSFQRSADRIGGTQPFVSAGLMGPMSPFTSAFLGNWDVYQTTNGTVQNQQQAQQQQPDHGVTANNGALSTNGTNWVI